MTFFSGFCKVDVEEAWLSHVLEDTEDDAVEVMLTCIVLCWWTAGLYVRCFDGFTLEVISQIVFLHYSHGHITSTLRLS